MNATLGWALRPTTLRFCLSDLVLFRRTFNAYHCLGHFTALPVDAFKCPDVTWPLDATALRYHSVPVSESLPRITVMKDVIVYVPAQYDRSYIDLRGDFEQYMKKFSGKSRSTLTRKVRKFGEEPGADFRYYSSGAELPEFFKFAYPLSKKTFQDRLLDAGLPDSDEFRAEAVRMADAGSAVAALLMIGERPAAYVYCPVEAGILLYEFVGYDPDLRALSPGTVLQYHLLERLFKEQRFAIFDFTEGEGQHKAFFSTHTTRCADVFIFRKTLGNRLLVFTHAAVDILSAFLGSVLERLHLKAAIKRLLRR